MIETKFFGEKLTDFEKNIFLKKQVETLKGLLTKTGFYKALSLKDIEIGKLTSERDELQHNYNVECSKGIELKHDFNEKSYANIYERLSKTQKKNFKNKMKNQLSENHKKQIAILEEVVIRKNELISELIQKLENQPKP